MHNEAIEIDEHFVLNTFDVNLIYLIILQSAPPTPQPVDAAGDSQDAGKLYKKNVILRVFMEWKADLIYLR